MVDPKTGAGGYIISGGGNGGLLIFGIVTALIIMLVGIGLFALPFLILFTLIAANITANLIYFWDTTDCDIGGAAWIFYLLTFLSIIPAIKEEAVRFFIFLFIGSNAAASAGNMCDELTGV